MIFEGAMNGWLDLVVKLTPAFVTLALGGFGAYIAWRQHYLAKQKLKLDLFDKRFAVVELVSAFNRSVFRDGIADDEAVASMARACSQAKLLFPSDLTDHLELVRKKAYELKQVRRRLDRPNSLQSASGLQEAAEKEQELILWLVEDGAKTSNRLFEKYMRFHD